MMEHRQTLNLPLLSRGMMAVLMAQFFSALADNAILIIAILVGVLLGGWPADRSLAWAFTGVMVSYGLAAAANLLIPRLTAENPDATFNPWFLIKKFFTSLGILFRNPDSRFNLLGTSVFWRAHVLGFVLGWLMFLISQSTDRLILGQEQTGLRHRATASAMLDHH